MKSTEATVFDRKSGAAEGPAVRPSQTQLRREYREFPASAAPFAHSRLAGAVSAGSAADSAVCFAAPVAASKSACSEEACSEEAYFAEAFAEEASAGPVWSSAPD
jgi:hypothetical protein